MRVLLSTYGSRGDVEPLVALAVKLQRRGAEVRMCAPPDQEFVDLLARESVPHVPFLKPWRSWERPPTSEERHQRVTDFITAQYDTVAEAASDCDVVVATAMSQFVAPSVAETLGIPYHYVLFCPDVVDGLDGRGAVQAPEVRARATSMAAEARVDGAAVAAELLLSGEA